MVLFKSLRISFSVQYENDDAVGYSHLVAFATEKPYTEYCHTLFLLNLFEVNNPRPVIFQNMAIKLNILTCKYIRSLASLGMTIHLVDQGEGKSGELSEIAGLCVLY